MASKPQAAERERAEYSMEAPLLSTIASSPLVRRMVLTIAQSSGWLLSSNMRASRSNAPLGRLDLVRGVKNMRLVRGVAYGRVELERLNAAVLAVLAGHRETGGNDAEPAALVPGEHRVQEVALPLVRREPEVAAELDRVSAVQVGDALGHDEGRGACEPTLGAGSALGSIALDEAEDCRVAVAVVTCAILMPVDDSELLVERADLRADLLHGRYLRQGLYVAHVVCERHLYAAVHAHVLDALVDDLVPLDEQRERGHVRGSEVAALW